MRIIGSDERSTGRASCRAILNRSHMGPFETIYIDEAVAVCDGGEGPLGHPRVYLNLAPAGKVECPYCSRLFVNRVMQPSEEGSATTSPTAAEERDT